ncbi:MAG: hypothetical protein KF775_16425 [Cyclobacteriaceae bacterium]|nr:hypothetical protein [Cyclobacteriaceae bacterium]
MNIKIQTKIISLIYLEFGICLLLFPNSFLTFFGCPLTIQGEMVARTFSAALLGNAFTHFFLKKISNNESVLQYVFIGDMLFNSLSGIVMTHATLTGTLNSWGWLPVGINILVVVISASIFNHLRNIISQYNGLISSHSSGSGKVRKM